MLLKDESGCLGEIIGSLGGCLELLEQRQGLRSHRLLNHRQLAQRCMAEDGLEPNAGGGNPTLPAGSPQRRTQLCTGHASGLSWSRCDGQNDTGIRMRQTTGPSVFERLNKRRVVLLEQ